MIKRSYKTKVQFYDIDSMGVVWHGNYVKYLEFARCEFLSEIGYDYNIMKEEGYAYPIVKMDFKFIKPAFFKDRLRIEIELEEAEGFLKFNYVILNDKNQKICTASTSQACIDIKTKTTQFCVAQKLKDILEGLI